MQGYIIRRLIQAAIVLFMVTIFVFLVMRLLPGDPIFLYVTQDDYGTGSITQEYLDDLRHEHGLDRPLVVQYFDWMGGIFHGDLGESIQRGTKVTWELGRSLPITLHLGILGVIASVIFGIPLGLIAAVRRGTWIDTLATTLANIGITAPVFWVGILLIYFFGIFLGWLPIYGYTSPLKDFGLNLREIIMPVFCISLFSIGGLARQTRSSLLEVIRQDYIRTARSKGLPDRVIFLRHALKNGLIPVTTVAGLQIRRIIGGQVIIETVFNIPGVGRLATGGIFTQDYALVQGVILAIATIVVLVNLVVDISYVWIDPRVKYR